MKITAQGVAFSSVVGCSVMLLNEEGACVGMLGLMQVDGGRAEQEAMRDRVVAAINNGPTEGRVYHAGRGSTYDVLARKALFQVSYGLKELGRSNTRPIHDGEPVTVYRNEHGTFVRFPDEMVPPRFEDVQS